MTQSGDFRGTPPWVVADTGTVTNRQLYDALVGIRKDFLAEVASLRAQAGQEIADLRVALAQLPCPVERVEMEELQTRMDEMERVQKRPINTKTLAAFAMTFAGLLGMDKIWQAWAAWVKAYEAGLR